MVATMQDQYIEVGIEQERYALRIYDIYEIIKMQTVTVIPKSKPYVKGVINLRGKVVPIISLRNRFELPEEPYTEATCIIVVNDAEQIVGIVVDRVHQVVTFNDIQPPPEQIGRVEGSFFSGIGSTETGLVSILKLEQLLHI